MACTVSWCHAGTDAAGVGEGGGLDGANGHTTELAMWWSGASIGSSSGARSPRASTSAANYRAGVVLASLLLWLD
jgi:hypothetical protein